ncbi:hypothetical protein EDB83DRAFT_2654801 [Lactarius deliciosus]|nr:hypothetical protein EDB83DRAFT_2654801 [Lactarius deliciosus]
MTSRMCLGSLPLFAVPVLRSLLHLCSRNLLTSSSPLPPSCVSSKPAWSLVKLIHCVPLRAALARGLSTGTLFSRPIALACPSVSPLPTWDVKPLTLLTPLGPTMLPLTHTTCVVKQSTRRIPRQSRRTSRVALRAPWERLNAHTYETGSDVLPPTVLSTRCGAVVLDEEDVEEGEPPAVAHCPWKDEIGVLVDPKLTDVFMAGMGLGAIWVEIVHSPETETGSTFHPCFQAVPPR